MTDVIPLKRRDASSLGEFVAGDQIPAHYIGGLIGKNLLINAEGMVNQRGFAGGVLAAGIYGYDRFKAGTGGCNFSISAGIWTHTSGPVVQVVEAPSGVYGANVTFSVEDPSATISVSVGGVSGTITAGSGRRGVTLAIPSGSGNLTVQWSATNAAYKRPQLERGDTATAFEYRPIGLELALCQRYYQQYSYAGGDAFLQAVIYNPTSALSIMYLPVPMRAMPAGISTVTLDITPGSYTSTNTIAQAVSMQAVAVIASGFTSGVSGNSGYMAYPIGNPGSIILDAEL